MNYQDICTKYHPPGLYGAHRRGADLYGADLYGANLYGADLYGADLRGADLYGADLRGADLYGADLRGANLRGADLYGADLRGADLYGADLGNWQIVPETGTFEGYKKLNNKTITHIRIPEDAKRTSSLIGRKCRASHVICISGSGLSTHNCKTNYNPGTTVTADSFDPDIRVECSNGIHFFITRKEAEEY